MESPALELAGVHRRLGGREVVRGLDLVVQPGEVMGLLGVNGAGKSTTLRLAAGLLAPDRGSVRIAGHALAREPGPARRALGYLPDLPPLHDELDAGEYLAFCARLHGVPRARVPAAVARALELCDLGALRRRTLARLSRGQRQRVGLAQAIVHAPALVLLDEPASGLDPVQAVRLRGLVRRLGGEGTAVLLSTHALADVAACCGRVAILHEGRLRHVGPALPEGGGGVRLELAEAASAGAFAGLAASVRADGEGGRTWFLQPAGGVPLQAVLADLIARGLPVTAFAPAPGTLESLFLGIASSREAA